MTPPINISSSQPAESVAAIEALSCDKPAIPFTFSSGGDTDLFKLLLATASNYPDATKSEIPPASSPALTPCTVLFQSFSTTHVYSTST